MKRIFALGMIVVIIFALCACSGNADNANVDYGSSDQFTLSEREAAVDCIKEEFKDFVDCDMTELSYCGDLESKENESFVAEGGTKDEASLEGNVIVFRSAFKTGEGSHQSGLNPNSEYDGWAWVLIRDSKTGEWYYYDGGLG